MLGRGRGVVPGDIVRRLDRDDLPDADDDAHTPTGYVNAVTLMARIASATGRPWDNSTPTRRSFATISSGLCFFRGIAGILQRLKKPASRRATVQGAGR